MSITGNLRTLELSELLQWLAQGKKTGTLVVENGETEKRILFQNGMIISSSSNDPQEHLGRFLVDRGYIDEATLEHAMKLQEATQILLGKVLVTLDSVEESDLEGILRLKTEESVYELFTWEEGDFRFLRDDGPNLDMVPVALEVTNLVMEGMRRIDEGFHISDLQDDPAAREAQDLEAASIPTIVVPEVGELEVEDIEVWDAETEEAAADNHHFEPAVEPAIEAVEGPMVEPVEEELPALETDEELPEEVPGSPEIRGYYQTIPKGQPKKAVIFAASAAALVLTAVVLTWAFRQQPDSGNTVAEAIISEPTPLPLAAVPLPLQDRAPVALEPQFPPPPTPEEIEQRVQGLVAAQTAEKEEALKEEYEAELASLRRQLALARQAALERERALQAARAAAETDRQPESTPSSGLERPTSATSGSTAFQPPSVVLPSPSPNTASQNPAASQTTTGGQSTPSDRVALPADGFEAGVLKTSDPAARASGNETTLGDAPIAPIRPPEPETRPGDIVDPGIGVTPPKLLRQPPPRYPPLALKMKRQATITVNILVDENGQTVEVRQVGDKAGLGFDQAALEAARRTVWEPPEKNGVRVKMWVQLTIDFRL